LQIKAVKDKKIFNLDWVYRFFVGKKAPYVIAARSSQPDKLRDDAAILPQKDHRSDKGIYQPKL
jgi:hypothetical protein